MPVDDLLDLSDRRTTHFEKPRSYRAKDKAANMGRISDATRFYIGHVADLTEELNEKPEPDQERRGQVNEPRSVSVWTLKSDGYV